MGSREILDSLVLVIRVGKLVAGGEIFSWGGLIIGLIKRRDHDIGFNAQQVKRLS